MSEATGKPSVLVCVASLLFLLAYEIGCSADSYVVASRAVVNSGGAGQSSVPGQEAGVPAETGVPADAGVTADAEGIPWSFDDTGQPNSAGLSVDNVEKLMKGGPRGTLRWLYPYEGTVFPGGTLAPTLMWDGDPETEAIYLSIKSNAFEYKTIIKPTFAQPSAVTMGEAGGVAKPPQPQFTIPQPIWDMACKKTQGKEDLFSLELSTLVKGIAAGPIRSHFYIAQGSVRGSVYYTSYGSVSALMRIPLHEKIHERAQEMPLDVDGACAGCHSISAKGKRLIAQTYEVSNKGFSFNLDPDSGVTERHLINSGNAAAMAALYPDGSKYLAQSLGPQGCWMYYNPMKLGFPLLDGPATLYDATTGKEIANTNIPPGAFMPMFSPDGTRLVFNDYEDLGYNITVMNYDTLRHEASEPKKLVQEDTSGAMKPTWPSFLPHNKAVIFGRTDSVDYCGTTTQAILALATIDPTVVAALPKSDLYIVDVITGTKTLLAKAMGFLEPDDEDRETYLPFGDNDLHQNYKSTVSPVAAGGYFWVFFDSPRNYGNLGKTRGIWGAAIDIRSDGKYTSDPSHPPFYLPGQDLSSSNHRAVAVLNPCKDSGESCSTGIDCCSGYCSSTPSSDGRCTPKRGGDCSRPDERCDTVADCCKQDTCINGFCALL